MVVQERKTEVRTKDPEVLARWMKRRKVSVRDLAFEVSTRKRSWSHGTIGNIRSGAQRSVNEDLSVRIANALDVPWEELFMERSSTVYREVQRMEPAA